MYGEDAIDVSSVRRWVRRFKNGENDSGDRPRSDWPHMAATTETKDAVDVPIRDGRRIATSELCAAVGIGKPAVLTIIRELGCRKFCTRSVPKMLAVEHRTARKEMCIAYLTQWERRRCFSIKNNYRWWNLDSSLRPINEWHQQSSPRKKKKKSKCRLLRVKSWLASSKTVKNIFFWNSWREVQQSF